MLCVTCAISAARVLNVAPHTVPSPLTVEHGNDDTEFSHVSSPSSSAGTESASESGGLHTVAVKA
eukprot:4802983-Pyramimonas_sp.AAC.1